MTKYEIEISRTSEKQLRRLPPDDRQRILAAILPLSGDPYPRGCRKLSGYHDVLRIRVGPYRILYSVSGRTLIIIILKIGHRKNVYR